MLRERDGHYSLPVILSACYSAVLVLPTFVFNDRYFSTIGLTFKKMHGSKGYSLSLIALTSLRARG